MSKRKERLLTKGKKGAGMQILSELECESYLESIKEQLGSWTDFWLERFTGVVIGRFFIISHNAGKELNRRITGERHTAIGFVKPVDGKTQINCLRFAGFSDPCSLVTIYILCLITIAICTYGLFPHCLWWALIPTAFGGLYTAIAHSVTERGVEGSRILSAFLVNPENYYMCI